MLYFLLVGGHAQKISTAEAQDDAYWSYDASGRVNRLMTHDIDFDGIEEILVISGQTDFLLLGADGNLRWQENTAGADYSGGRARRPPQ